MKLIEYLNNERNIALGLLKDEQRADRGNDYMAGKYKGKLVAFDGLLKQIKNKNVVL